MLACILGAISGSTYVTFVDVTPNLIKVKPYLVKETGQETRQTSKLKIMVL